MGFLFNINKTLLDKSKIIYIYELIQHKLGLLPEPVGPEIRSG